MYVGGLFSEPVTGSDARSYEMMSRAPTFTSPFHRIRKIKGNDVIF